MSKQYTHTIHDILSKAVDLTHDGIAIFDEQDIGVFCNDPFATLFGYDRSEQVVGLVFSQLIRNCYETKRGINVEAEDIEQWIDMAMSKRRSKPFRTFETDTFDGRWFRITEQIVDQHLFIYITDVTQSKLQELELKRMQHQLTKLATTDSLTSIYNRRHFYELANAELDRCGRAHLPCSLMMLDIDKFKLINDNHCHECGDWVLKEFVQVINSQLRSYDIFGRIGGEEFAIILPDTDLEAALTIAERCRAAVSDHTYHYADVNIAVTVSIGLVSNQVSNANINKVVKQADEYLYEAKHKGRNCVCSPPVH